jgi:hypothetical protein
MHAPSTVAASTVATGVATTLAAGGYIGDAVDALASTNVYVSSEVGGASDLASQLEQQIGDASIGVAVFSDNASLEASGPEIVAELASQTGYQTIVVAVGDDLSAGSRVLAPGEAMRIANEAEQTADSVDDALTQTVQEIVAVSDTPSEPAPSGADGGVVVGLALVVAVLLGAGIAVIAGLRARSRRRAIDNRGLPESLQAQIATLRALSPSYAQVGAAGNAVAAQTAPKIDELADNTTELFARLDRRSVEDQVNIAAVEYDDKLRKLTAALNTDYLLDLLTHPHLWDDPGDRIREVQTALDGVSTELVENIKQVNARRALHFQVSLDGLIGRRKELQDWDRAFDAAADDGTGAPPAAGPATAP